MTFTGARAADTLAACNRCRGESSSSTTDRRACRKQPARSNLSFAEYAKLKVEKMGNATSKEIYLAPLEHAAQNSLILGLFLPIQSGAWSSFHGAARHLLDLRLQCALYRASRAVGFRSGFRAGAVAGQRRLRRQDAISRQIDRSASGDGWSCRAHQAHHPDFNGARSLWLASPASREIRCDYRQYERRTLGTQCRHWLQEKRVRDVWSRADGARLSL